MDFTHTEERRMIADQTAKMIANAYPIDVRHNHAESEFGFSRDMWAQFAELGLIGALFREEVGGFGGAGFDLTVIFQELGRGLVVEPFLATLLAGTALQEAGSEAQKARLESVISGETLIAFAHGEPDGRYELSHVRTTAEAVGSNSRLTGNKAVVINGDAADHIIVSARHSGDHDDRTGLSLYLVDKNAEGLLIRGYPTVDGLHAAELTLTNVEGEVLEGAAEDAYPVIEKIMGAGVLALSAEALGAMDVASKMTLDYLKTRTQFGRPIGTFQALQHRMADMMMEIEQMRSSVINAADRFDGDYVSREWALSAAKNLTGTIGRMVAEESIQLHGGIAMTWEYALGHYAKRIVMIDHVLGDADHHMERAISLSRNAA
ncbi:MAG: acyl-CoA dehydrogenase family protein [Pseudomonadota bacterium]